MHLLWAGHEAVILFFMLSGFVLAVPFVDGRSPTYLSFAVRRAWRVYVPYVVISGAAALLATWISGFGVPNLSDWFNVQWARPATVDDLLNLAYMGGLSGNIFNPPSWSLVYELRISAILPLLALMACRVKWPTGMVAALALVSIGAMCAMAATPLSDLFRTLEYTGLFLAGAICARHRVLMSAWWRRRSARIRGSLCLLGLALYLGQWLPMRFGLQTDALIGCGALVLICAALAEPRAIWLLASTPLRWLGRVSFSLYLCHVPVLLTLVYTLGRMTTPLIAVLLYPIAALCCAEVLHRVVEAPCLETGRRMGHRFDTEMRLLSAIERRRRPGFSGDNKRVAPPISPGTT